MAYAEGRSGLRRAACRQAGLALLHQGRTGRRRRQREVGHPTAAGRWFATPPHQSEHQPVTALAGLTTRRQAREILRRSRRIAGILDGQAHHEEAVQSICELLAQEGDLVGELLEEIVARSCQQQPPSGGNEPASGGDSQSPYSPSLPR